MKRFFVGLLAIAVGVPVFAALCVSWLYYAVNAMVWAVELLTGSGS